MHALDCLASVHPKDLVHSGMQILPEDMLDVRSKWFSLYRLSVLGDYNAGAASRDSNFGVQMSTPFRYRSTVALCLSLSLTPHTRSRGNRAKDCSWLRGSGGCTRRLRAFVQDCLCVKGRPNAHSRR